MLIRSKVFITLSVLVLIGANISESSIAQASLIPHTAEYKVYYAGIPAGKASFELTQTSEKEGTRHFMYRSKTRSSGMVRLLHRADIEESSHFTMTGAQLYPQHYEYRLNAKDNPRRNEVRFDWPLNQAESFYKDRSKTLAVTPGMLDRMSMRLAIMEALRAGQTKFTFQVIDRLKIKTYSFAIVGEETLKTASGTYTTIKVKRTHSEKKIITFWCAKELDYIPIQIEQQEKKDGTIARMKLVAYQAK